MSSQRAKFEIRIQRVYEKSSVEDRVRFLVDGLWPRGISKRALKGVAWIKEVAPSGVLRKWYGHDPEKWKEFQKRYRAELAKNREAWKPLLDAAQKSDVTLLTATHDVEISHATVLRDFLKKKS